MNITDALGLIDNFIENGYQITHLTLDNYNELNLFRFSAINVKKNFKIAVTVNNELKTYRMHLTFERSDVTHSSEYSYKNYKTLLAILKENVNNYFDSYFPTTKHMVVLSKEEYEQIIPQLSF